MDYDGEYKKPIHASYLANQIKGNESNIEYKKRKCKFPEKQKMLKDFAIKGENDNPWLMVLSPLN